MRDRFRMLQKVLVFFFLIIYFLTTMHRIWGYGKYTNIVSCHEW